MREECPLADKITNYQCPACTGPLHFDPATGKLVCDYCGSSYTTDEIEAIYAAESGGWVVQVTESGSQGLVTMMVGVSPDYTCTGVSVTESSETAGLGAIAGQASEKGDAFRSQFVGASGTVAVTKEGGAIDAISGATITSKAVCRGVTAALAACQALG